MVLFLDFDFGERVIEGFKPDLGFWERLLFEG
jgi:hypothetical protein